MQPNEFFEAHVVDAEDGHVSTGRGRLVVSPIKKIIESSGRRVAFVGYASQNWQDYYKQLPNEMVPRDRIVDNCQDYAISIAFHLSAFRVWTFVLSFKEFQRARVLLYLVLLGLSFFTYVLERFHLGISMQYLPAIAKLFNPASSFLILVTIETERLRKGTAMRNVNIWRHNWATWKRTWTKKKSLGVICVAVLYVLARPRLYTVVTPMDFLMAAAALIGVLVWLKIPAAIKARRSFLVPRPLFEPTSLVGYDPDSGTVPSISFESFQSVREIRPIAIGFSSEDLAYASQRFANTEQLANFLNLPEDAVYDIGVAFVGGSDNTWRLGHAEVIVRDGNLDRITPPKALDLTASPPAFTSEPISVQYDGKIFPGDTGSLRVLHIRNAGEDTADLVLALEEINPPRSVRFYRYANLYRIRITENMLKHIALLSCPEKHRLLAEDCATFAYNVLTMLLGHLRDRGYITEEVFRLQKKLLVQTIHIADGSVGESEITSREHEALGESGHSSAAIALKAAAKQK
ncbi:hypothetical protein BDV24DRAFT_161864 [Aspergillus arachidicola]|uniref:Uncharacterized protein n=1 Tax=Aspergillus arachidicola TaxID=656916 RepID=A0A5N6YC40_9EURO|nr:hypothetical protein BDV24DRAFT_161864 [Aspergillus arachidicola]